LQIWHPADVILHKHDESELNNSDTNNPVRETEALTLELLWEPEPFAY